MTPVAYMTHRKESRRPPAGDDRLFIEALREHPVLTREEHAELAAKIQKGDQDARWKLVLHNLRFGILYMTRKFPTIEADAASDIVVDALWRAAGRFDPEKGTFTTYCQFWLFQVASRHLFQLPAGLTGPKSKYERGVDEKTGERTYRRRRRRDVAVASILPEIAEDPEFEEALPLGRFLKDPRLLKVVRMHFGFEGGEKFTLSAIGDELGVTRERVRQLKNNAMDILRASPRFMQELKDFVDSRQERETAKKAVRARDIEERKGVEAT